MQSAPEASRARPEAARGAEALHLFGTLPGRWAIDRRFSGGERFSGVAEFVRESERTLGYEERGHLELPNGERFESRRRYSYQLASDVRGEMLEVHFRGDETLGGLFLRIDPATGKGTHFCDPDLYEAQYRFDSPERFQLRYQVKGPRKDYVSDTSFQRIDAR